MSDVVGDLFHLSVPAWELGLRAALIYVALLILARVSGKRTIGEFTPFDLVVILLLAESAQGALLSGEDSILGAIIVASVLVALNLLVAIGTARSPRFSRLIEGNPVVLVRNGQLLRSALRRNHIPVGDVEEAARRAQLESIDRIALATLETSGEITVVPSRRDVSN